VAPGISVDDHIRPQVAFELKVADQLRPMDPRIFADGAMGLRTGFAE
jgi:acyl CoA:acetate/3-ketoacid CoA transferase